MRATLIFGLIVCLGGASEARRPRRAKKLARPPVAVRAPSGESAKEAARADAQIAELKQLRELPQESKEELDFPGQQLDDAERPPSSPRR
jgi:hypothetical protein